MVPKSITLNGMWPLFCVISPNSVAFVASYVKVVGKPSTDSLPRSVITTPTKHDGHAVLFVVAELLVVLPKIDGITAVRTLNLHLRKIC